MKRRLPALLAALASLTLVVWFVWQDSDRLSPGRLSATHAQERGLESRCEQCHADAPQAMASACGECHREILDGIAGKSGLHGQLPGVERCGTCHSEHHGEDYQLVSATTFARSGIAERSAYAHDGLDFGLQGAHAKLACKQCHAHADDVLLAKGNRRFLGLEQACGSCHEDPHSGKLPDCASCHDQSAPFATAALFEHTSAFPLIGAHGELGCAQCHEPGSARAFEAYAVAGAQPNLRKCQDCHASPHRSEFLLAVALDCDGCHSAQAQGFTASKATLTHEQHALSGFALVAPHDKQQCSQCHEQGLEGSRPPRMPQDCVACHADPHGGQFQEQTCAQCHEGEHFAPSLFEAARHAAAGFALRDSHSKLECKACHRTVAGLQQFRNLANACSDCHEDVHRGQFQDRSCAQCHDERAFVPALYTTEQHAAAGFPLQGSHASLDCKACHQAQADGSRQFHGTPRECASCHKDPHQGQFGDAGCAQCHGEKRFAPSLFDAARHAEAGFALQGAHARVICGDCHRKDGSAQLFRGLKHACADCHRDPHAGALPAAKGCAECHTEESFALAAASFDHARWTGFALHGAHFAIPCEACHRTLPPTEAGTQDDGSNAELRRKARAKGNQCQDCHADPHAGQFRDAHGKTGCAQCHRNESDFRITSFDHQTMSRFPLDKTHGKLACSACHRPVPAQDGTSNVRFKPLGTTCGDCHDPRR